MKFAVDKCLRENQYRFRTGRSTNDIIFTLRQIIEKSLEFQMPCYVNYIDFQKAFGCIDGEMQWKILEDYGMPAKYGRIIQQNM